VGWIKLEGDLADSCSYLEESKVRCYYARIRVPGGYGQSKANQLISNLKKSVSKKGTGEWYYKEQAVKQFAVELNGLLNSNLIDELAICFLPSSKRVDDPEYDPRWIMLEQELKRLNPRYRFEAPIEVQESQEAYHVGSASRNPQNIMMNYKWVGFKGEPPKYLIFVDDVLTTGGHLRAAEIMVTQNCPEIEDFGGAFWTKHQFADPADDFDIIED